MKKFIALLFCLIFITPSLCFADQVVFNTKTKKIHATSCHWVNKCTVNCIKIQRKEAIKRGGIPCKVCGGR